MELSNPYFVLILGIILLIFAIESMATWLNLCALRPELPEDFRDVFDEEKYRRSQAYVREDARLDLLSASVRLAIFLAFWLGGGFGWLDALVRAWTTSPITAGLLCFSLLFMANLALGLPFTWYETFVLEQKYGFNKTTPATFLTDQIKGLVLAALLGLPLLGLLLWVFGKYSQAWIWAWLAVTAYVLIMAYVGPRFLMPLFNKFTPLADGELKQAITAMAQRCGFPFGEISIMDGSRRSTRSNAFFAGFGKNKKIALFDTLVEKHTTPELVAVLAHEIGHFKKRHIVQHLAMSVLQIGLLFFLLGMFLNNEQLFAAFGVPQTSVYLSFVFFLFLFQPVQFLVSIFMAIWSRKHEFEADAFASKAVGGPSSMISALKKLAQDNLTNLTPHPFYVFVNYSHPPMRERLAALRQTEFGHAAA